MGGIAISAIIFIRNQTNERKALLTSTHTNFTSNDNDTSDDNDTSTTIKVPSMSLSYEQFNCTLFSLDTCFMTLKYQSESYPTDLNPETMVIGDINRDSIVDIVVADSNSDTLSVMLGNRNGTFQTAHTLSTGNGSCPKQVRLADFNNDAILDLSMTIF